MLSRCGSGGRPPGLTARRVSRESLRELASMVSALREDNEFDFTRLRGLMKVATS